MEKEEESIEELDALEEIIKADIPTAEGDIPLYDEVIKSPEFSELENDEEAKIITETVKRNDSDGEPYETQEKITVIEEEINTKWIKSKKFFQNTFIFIKLSYLCIRQVLHNQLLLNPPGRERSKGIRS